MFVRSFLHPWGGVPPHPYRSFPMWFYAVLYKASLAYGDRNDVITSWNAVGILTELGLHIH